MKKITLVILLLAVASIACFSVYSNPPEQKESASLVCLYRDTALRTSPTGYIIVRLYKGTQVFLNKVESPFAYVSYFDGSRWLDGTVTASYLGICGADNGVKTKGG